jgi:hypothetical protein
MSDKEKTDKGTLGSTPKESSKKRSTKKAARKASMPRRARVYTFEQWARRRGVKQHHKRGLRAYVPDVERSRSLEEWTDCFKDY